MSELNPGEMTSHVSLYEDSRGLISLNPPPIQEDSDVFLYDPSSRCLNLRSTMDEMRYEDNRILSAVLGNETDKEEKPFTYRYFYSVYIRLIVIFYSYKTATR